MKEVRSPVSQFGPVFTLPLRTAPFTTKSVTAVFLNAEKELEAAKKALAAPTEAQQELATLQADTALLNAQLANLQAQEALQNAQQVAASP